MWGMKPYSKDLRQRIVSCVEGGLSKSAAARLFNVSLSSVKRYSRISERGGSLEPRKGGGRPPKTDFTMHRLLEEDIQKRPWATIRQRRSFLEGVTGKSLSESTVGRLLRRLGFSQKNGVWERVRETSS